MKYPPHPVNTFSKSFFTQQGSDEQIKNGHQLTYKQKPNKLAQSVPNASTFTISTNPPQTYYLELVTLNK